MKRILAIRPRHRSDSGFALVIGLLLLVVMSVLGVTMVNVTRLETLMAGGSREANIAFQATEAGLRDAELRIDATGALKDFPNEPWFRAEGRGARSGEPDFFAAATWSDDDDETSSTPITLAYPELGAQGSAYQPRYVIKHVGYVTNSAADKQAIAIGGYAQGGAVLPTSVFRITARGTSRDGSAETILQSYFGKVYQ